MTEEQKRFKILKVKSYNKQISKAKKDATIEAFIAGFLALGAIYYVQRISNTNINTELSTKIYNAISLLFDCTFSIYFFKQLLISISTKTMFESKVEDINVELEMDEIIKVKNKRK